MSERYLPESSIRSDEELERVRLLFSRIGHEPHPGQLAFLRYNTRYRVLLNGRRWGKTHLLAMAILLHIQEMHQLEHPSPRVRLIAPENKQIQETLNYLKLLCHELGLPIREQTNPRDWHLYAGRVKIEPRSGKNRETHRGAGITFAVIDECSEISGDLFHYAIRPSLTDYRGHVLMAGTPKGRNWVIDWVESEGIEVPYGWTDESQILISPRGDFLFMRAPTWQNTYLPPDEIVQIRGRFYQLRGMSEGDLSPTDAAFLQEYGAVVLIGYQRPFPIEPLVVDRWSSDDLEQMRYADWVLGLDYGYVAPSACVLAGYCPDGIFRVPVVGYEVKIDDREYVSWVASHLMHKVGQKPLRMVIADPAFWSNTGLNENTSLSSLLGRLGVPIIQGIRERVARWRHLRLMLSEQRVILYRPQCAGLLDEFDRARPSDPYGSKGDIKKPDHALSALAHATEYVLRADPPPFGDPSEAETPIQEEIEEFLSTVYPQRNDRRIVRRRAVHPIKREMLSKRRWL